MRERLVNRIYFNWLVDLISRNRYSEEISYRKLLSHLHSIDFRYSILMDQNREEDGINLRYRFALTQGYENSIDEILDILDGPCSVLEMMVALALRCEETIMDDPEIGDRTRQWFWGMVVSLGLGSMYDSGFNDRYVDDVIERFLDRDYDPDGSGGLFTIKHCDRDLRTVEIWHQLCWYLNSIT